jgi:hypothetical protein
LAQKLDRTIQVTQIFAMVIPIEERDRQVVLCREPIFWFLRWCIRKCGKRVEDRDGVIDVARIAQLAKANVKRVPEFA